MPVRKEKQLWIPETVLLRKRAQLDYEAKLSDSRTGVALNKEEFYRMDEIVSSAIQKDNTSTTSSHQMNCRLQELLSTDTLKRLSFHKAY